MYTTEQLLALAAIYRQWSGVSESRMGLLAAENDRLFFRLAAGYGCYADTAQRASNWFNANWPSGLAWPEGVPDRRIRPSPNPPGDLEPVAYTR